MNSLIAVNSDPKNQIQIHENENTNGFLHRLASLVAFLYVTFSQISQKDRQEVVATEKEVTKYTKLNANALESQGATALKTAVAAAVVFAISFGFQGKNDQIFVQTMSGHIPKIGELFTTQQMGSSKINESITAIKQMKLQEKSSKAQSEGNVKEAFAQVLQAEIARLREASSSRG